MSLDAPDRAAVTVSHHIPRRYVALGLIVVVIVVLGALLVLRHNKNQTNTAAVETYTPAPPSIMDPLTHIPASTMNAAGATAAASTPPTGPLTPLRATTGTTLWSAPSNDGTIRPVVFFYGAEFAPYAAAERWPLIVALSRFGKFGSVGLMQSSTSVAFSDTSTFTFWHTTYSSKWITLQTVERYSSLNPTGARYTTLEIPTTRQAAAVSTYDPTGSTFPLLDVANRYVLVGSNFSPSILAGLSQSAIVGDLTIPTSPITQSIAVSANQITAAICSVTKDQPSAVCHSRGVSAASDKLGVKSEPVSGS